MKRPAPVTASIVVFSILLFLAAGAFSLAVAVSRSRAAPANPAAFATMAITLGLPVVAWIIDIVFLAVRRRWVHYYNIVLVALTILACAGFVLASQFLIPVTAQLPVGMRVTMGVIYAVPAGLLSWLLAELIRREEVREYLARSPGAAAPSAGTPGVPAA